MKTFANAEAAKKVIKELYPQTKEVSFVDHGYDNLVVLVDKKYVVRFPRNESAYVRSQYEKQVLLELSSLEEVEIPRILGEGDNLPYLITSFLHGEHISSTEINGFLVEKQKAIGEKIAKFAFAMHSLLSVKRTKEMRKKLKLDKQAEEPWDIYFEKVLFASKFPTKIQDELAKKYYGLWKSLAYSTPEVAVHDDLHTENMLFENDELTGILDFGDTNIGTPEQELRQLYRINGTVLETAVQVYQQLSGYKLNIEAIKIWAIIQELAAYSDRLFKNDLTHPAFFRSARNLNSWLPEGKWESGIKGSQTATKQ